VNSNFFSPDMAKDYIGNIRNDRAKLLNEELGVSDFKALSKRELEAKLEKMPAEKRAQVLEALEGYYVADVAANNLDFHPKSFRSPEHQKVAARTDNIREMAQSEGHNFRSAEENAVLLKSYEIAKELSVADPELGGKRFEEVVGNTYKGMKSLAREGVSLDEQLQYRKGAVKEIAEKNGLTVREDGGLDDIVAAARMKNLPANEIERITTEYKDKLSLGGEGTKWDFIKEGTKYPTLSDERRLSARSILAPQMMR
jgi:hypothetical protein